ncbi:hypothetical protein ACFORH_43450 [Amycolatopsis roodepoortensis]|uniref:Uncharacterized protein n=1 Tax=Amycolatopsis roodepoortensis TaxID=700274 RepID=A0ABR9LI88_9PSEU|nr:hypothetical protein [Amycolatopsis roodepoortensis]MBE1580401.1 hypothetical protein [Amycolatopsis roodepoortensis]
MTWISTRQQDRDHNGQRNDCGACGHEGTAEDPLVLTDTGSRVHNSHITDPGSGLYGARQTNP